MPVLEEALDAVVPKALSKGGICGAVIAVGRKTGTGYEEWQKAYGYMRTQPAPAPMRADAIFDVASLTKPIATGTSLMILVEQGKVGLDDPVGKCLPEFNEADRKDVAIRHLMTHMSGMPPYVGADQQKVIKDQAGFPCPAATRAYIRALDLANPPGEKMVYSCLNAILCAEIVEAVSGRPLDDFSTVEIFQKLHMGDTGFRRFHGVHWEFNFRGRHVPTTRADWTQFGEQFLRGEVHDPLAAMQAGVSGNAGLFSTAADLSRFAQMMLNGGELDGVRILKEETIRAMTRVQNPGSVNKKGEPAPRGLLWGVYPPNPDAEGVDSLSAYGHTGYTGTAIRLYPEQGVYIIALANRVHPDDSGKVSELRQRVWETVGQVLMGATGHGE